ncbi:N-acetylglucosamine-6-phosphate deacetylase [Paenibacillus sp. F411]|uniref:N-acetylglucosamine-6-phosphate deacetylase n=1 Tax=Paenibacillus sp. F411 TaxID=2820239 RepID=UPI001AAEFC89|nr:N-acetylglucosamine-6-phosphate deacetylase [Paenibacillus sp. F411]MBO2943683.1 N-acetylglucosamine-6-phosphate deacetylase [Paenibacillus sp. F411]
MKTLWKNADIIRPGQRLSGGQLLIDSNGVIEAIGARIECPSEPLQVRDGEGLTLVPGFIDVHVHGGDGCNVMDAREVSLERMSVFHAAHGTTGFLATTNTSSQEHIVSALSCAAGVIQKGTGGADILGIHLEGPFISLKRKGAQLADDVRNPSPEQIEELLQAAENRIKLVTLAPELEGGMDAVEQFLAAGVTVSAGHSDATFKQMEAAVALGVNHTTHHFNGMSPLHHREPGLAGAGLLLPQLTVELIADGYHVHPAVVKMMYDLKSSDGICAITDAVTSCGLPDGDYGHKVMKDGLVYLKGTDTLAGSSLTMIQAVRNVLAFTGLALEDIISSFTSVPARQIGVDGFKGSLAPGKDADFVVLDAGLNVVSTWVRGKAVYEAGM